MPSVTVQLSEVLTKRGFDDLPPDVVHEAKRLLLDYLGVTLAGSVSETGKLAAGFALEQAGPPQARVLGHDRLVGAVHAAFANAISAHSLEFDDIDNESFFHSSAPVVSAALAVAELQDSSGGNLLAAVVAGCETLARLSHATNPELLARGFHSTAACGVFGGTAAAALLLGTSPEEMASALGLAGAQASGVMEIYGASMVKRFNPGPAARNAVTAALLARSGFTAEETVLEGERGFGAAFAGVFRTDSFLSGLGTSIPLPFEFKRYGCCRPIHCAIDAALEIRKQANLHPSQVETIKVYRHPMWDGLFGVRRPRSCHEARVSMPYSIALALVEGTALPQQYASVGVSDHEVMQLSEKVVIKLDPSFTRNATVRVVITTVDGRTLTSELDYASGSARFPMSDEDLWDKFHALVDDLIGRERAELLREQVWRAEQIDHSGDLTQGLRVRNMVPTS